MISIVIPAHNEQETIGKCLASLTAQTTRHPFEVIVVDNASTDNTAEIARRFSAQLNVRVIYEPRKGRGQARRTGCAMARGNILLCTDSDAQLPVHWIDAVTEPLLRDQYIAVRGGARIADCSPVVNMIYATMQPLLGFLHRLWFGHWVLIGGNAAVWKWAYEAAGGFNAALDAHEDWELTRRLQKLGALRYVRGCAATVSGRRYRDGFLPGLMAYYRSFAKKFWLKEQWVTLENVR